MPAKNLPDAKDATRFRFGPTPRVICTEQTDGGPPTQAAPSSNDAAIRIDGDAISISQNGGAFEELRLGNTPEAAHLRKLLQEAGAGARSVTVPVGSMIVASGGGSGKGSKPKQQTQEQSTTEKGS